MTIKNLIEAVSTKRWNNFCPALIMVGVAFIMEIMPVAAQNTPIKQGASNNLKLALTFTVKGAWSQNDSAHTDMAPKAQIGMPIYEQNPTTQKLNMAWPYEYVYSITPNAKVNGADMAIYEIGTSETYNVLDATGAPMLTPAVNAITPNANTGVYGPQGAPIPPYVNYFTPNAPNNANPTMYAVDAPLTQLSDRVISIIISSHAGAKFQETLTLTSYPLYPNQDFTHPILIDKYKKIQTFVFTGTPNPATGKIDWQLSN
jgi:hypothetical protein